MRTTGRTALTRRTLAGAALLAALAACGDETGPPTADDVRETVERRLRELRDRFVAGDMAGMPPEVTRMGEAQRRDLRRTVGAAEIVAFRSGAFALLEEARWRGPVSLDVRVPSPLGPISLLYRVTATPTISRVRGRWTVLSWGAILAEPVQSGRWEAT